MSRAGYPSDMSQSANSVTSASRFLIAAMGVVLILLLALAWQTAGSIQAHNETAMAVLEDYAELAADAFSRRAMVAVGYNGYRQAMTEFEVKLQNDAELPDDLAPAAFAFGIDAETKEIVTAGRREVSLAERALIVEMLLRFTQRQLPESGLVVLHHLRNDLQYSFVVKGLRDKSALFGYAVDRNWLGQTLAGVYDSESLLPESLADGAITNDMLYVEMRDAVNEVLFSKGTRDVYDAAGVVHLEDEYSGIFRGHTVTVAINPKLASSLIIGGLPMSRLPFVIAIIVLAVVLLVASIWQLRREQALAKLRSDFVAEVSHELRTPLTQIRMFTESLMLGRMEKDDEQERALSIVNRETQRMIHLVENILRFSGDSQARNGLDRQRQPLAPVVTSVVEEFRVIADAVGSRIVATVDEGIEAEVDSDALRQILLNLLDNAIKYGPKGQTVEVSVEQQDDEAILAVSDAGPGVPRKDRDRIWQGFHRLDRERQAAKAGAGIGLAVVQDLVRRHDGTVHVEDNDGGGARFVVQLPV